jgi:pimeloyl-ACP methyl ester carboxylesterase
LNYWITHSSKFIDKYAGKNVTSKILSMVETYEKANPGKPVEIRFLPRIVRMMFRGMSLYDPNFGDAFYTGTWNDNFDHTEALKKIQCPALLLHASFETMEDGTLEGAMNQADADKAISLLLFGTYKRIKAMHVVHLDKPDEFIKTINKFFLDK